MAAGPDSGTRTRPRQPTKSSVATQPASASRRPRVSCGTGNGHRDLAFVRFQAAIVPTQISRPNSPGAALTTQRNSLVRLRLPLSWAHAPAKSEACRTNLYTFDRGLNPTPTAAGRARFERLACIRKYDAKITHDRVINLWALNVPRTSSETTATTGLALRKDRRCRC